MPTMEIISFEAKSIGLNQTDFEFKVEEENKLESHRSLFVDYLKVYNGVIIHLGNKRQIGDNSCWASDLIDWDKFPEKIIIPNINDPKKGSDQSINYKFMGKYREKINELLKIALNCSPIRKAAILTDYQFGPEKSNIENIISIKNFWKRHDENGLIFNTLYEYVEM
jgi:hypothetical protein